MSAQIQFSKEEKQLMIEKIKAYFSQELGQEIGGFDAEFLLDFFVKEVGIFFYNRGLYDGLDEIRLKLDTLADDVAYALEKPTEH